MKKTLVLTSIFAIMTVAPAVANIPSSAFMQQQITAQITEAIADKADTTVVTALDNKIGTLPTGYETVGAALSAMVSTAASANQTLAGSYTVSGSMNFTGNAYAPTAELPPPPTDSGNSGDDGELGGSAPSGNQGGISGGGGV